MQIFFSNAILQFVCLTKMLVEPFSKNQLFFLQSVVKLKNKQKSYTYINTQWSYLFICLLFFFFVVKHSTEFLHFLLNFRLPCFYIPIFYHQCLKIFNEFECGIFLLSLYFCYFFCNNINIYIIKYYYKHTRS